MVLLGCSPSPVSIVVLAHAYNINKKVSSCTAAQRYSEKVGSFSVRRKIMFKLNFNFNFNLNLIKESNGQKTLRCNGTQTRTLRRSCWQRRVTESN
jgi:hypothetical protein